MKKSILMIFLSIILGIIFSLYIYYEYRNKNIVNTVNYETTKVYLLQIAAFKNSDNVTKFTKVLPNYYVEYDNNIYHIYIGILKNKDNLKKIKEFYKVFGNNIYVREKNINSNEFSNMISTYENIISNTNKKEVIYTVNKELLNKYKELVEYGKS